MRGLCDLAHRAWRGRGLRHWGSLPLHGQVSITRGYSLVSLCLVLFDCASHASEAWCSAGDGSDTCPSVTLATPSVAPVRRSDSICRSCAMELSPHPHQARSNVNRSARLPRYLDRTICLIPPIPGCERT